MYHTITIGMTRDTQDLLFFTSLALLKFRQQPIIPFGGLHVPKLQVRHRVLEQGLIDSGCDHPSF